MKKDRHPEYTKTKVVCSCGNVFVTRSTVPEIHVEICNECHPYYTGTQKVVDSAGRLQKFQEKYADYYKKQEEEKEEQENS